MYRGKMVENGLLTLEKNHRGPRTLTPTEGIAPADILAVQQITVSRRNSAFDNQEIDCRVKLKKLVKSILIDSPFKILSFSKREQEMSQQQVTSSSLQDQAITKQAATVAILGEVWLKTCQSSNRASNRGRFSLARQVNTSIKIATIHTISKHQINSLHFDRSIHLKKRLLLNLSNIRHPSSIPSKEATSKASDSISTIRDINRHQISTLAPNLSTSTDSNRSNIHLSNTSNSSNLDHSIKFIKSHQSQIKLSKVFP